MMLGKASLAAIVLGVAMVAGCTAGEAPAATTAEGLLLEKAREVAAGLDTPEKAWAAGYRPDEYCIPGMGVHWIHRPGEAGSYFDATLDVLRPEVVLFLPDTSDTQAIEGDRFLGIEYVVVTQDMATNSTETVPSLMGVKLAGPMAGHTPTMPWHAELHIYLAEGLESDQTFPEAQPGITCPAGTTPPMG